MADAGTGNDGAKRPDGSDAAGGAGDATGAANGGAKGDGPGANAADKPGAMEARSRPGAAKDAATAGDANAKDAEDVSDAEDSKDVKGSGGATAGVGDAQDAPPADQTPTVSNTTPTPVGRQIGDLRWWQQQRWLIPIAMIVIAIVAFWVGRVVALGPDASLEEVVGAAASEPSEVASEVAQEPSPESEPEQDQQGEQDQQEQQRSRRTVRACDRIVAFQQDIVSSGLNPISAYNELAQIRELSQNTPLAGGVNALLSTLQDLMFGQATTTDVVNAGQKLVSAC